MKNDLTNAKRILRESFENKLRGHLVGPFFICGNLGPRFCPFPSFPPERLHHPDECHANRRSDGVMTGIRRHSFDQTRIGRRRHIATLASRWTGLHNLILSLTDTSTCTMRNGGESCGPRFLLNPSLHAGSGGNASGSNRRRRTMISGWEQGHAGREPVYTFEK